jgi:hypothetical protein
LSLHKLAPFEFKPVDVALRPPDARTHYNPYFR